MAIRFSCYACGQRFAAKDEHKGHRWKCPACGVGIEVPDQMNRVDWSPAPESATAGGRPLWKDPIVVIGTAVPTLILAWFFVYLLVERAEKEFEGRAVQLKLEADRLARSRESRQAYEKYLELLAM